MSGVVAAASSSSCSATFSSSSNHHSIKNSQLPQYSKSRSLLNPSSQSQKTSFQGLSLREDKRFVSDSFFGVENTKGSAIARRGLEIAARAAGAAKTIEVEVDKPLGLTLGQKSGGGVVITGVDGGGNAAKAGLRAGDQVLYTSSFFGDELWPADKLGFTKTAIQAKPDSVYFVVRRFSSFHPFVFLSLNASILRRLRLDFQFLQWLGVGRPESLSKSSSSFVVQWLLTTQGEVVNNLGSAPGISQSELSGALPRLLTISPRVINSHY
ncbi:uncharacterized protein LOC114748183 [Neltuma alba]|uniref:uncharacterized protein LOC114748183 n=1 Tax=Neltuma alba TaxID=207710 RepID=UPI0010A32D3F|nr:uncharacterized protein LOC114748183 [Prosopis alba]